MDSREKNIRIWKGLSREHKNAGWFKRKQSKSKEANKKYQDLYIHGKLMCDITESIKICELPEAEAIYRRLHYTKNRKILTARNET